MVTSTRSKRSGPAGPRRRRGGRRAGGRTSRRRPGSRRARRPRTGARTGGPAHPAPRRNRPGRGRSGRPSRPSNRAPTSRRIVDQMNTVEARSALWASLARSSGSHSRSVAWRPGPAPQPSRGGDRVEPAPERTRPARSTVSPIRSFASGPSNGSPISSAADEAGRAGPPAKQAALLTTQTTGQPAGSVEQRQHPAVGAEDDVVEAVPGHGRARRAPGSCHAEVRPPSTGADSYRTTSAPSRRNR